MIIFLLLEGNENVLSQLTMPCKFILYRRIVLDVFDIFELEWFREQESFAEYG